MESYSSKNCQFFGKVEGDAEGNRVLYLRRERAAYGMVEGDDVVALGGEEGDGSLEVGGGLVCEPWHVEIVKHLRE